MPAFTNPNKLPLKELSLACNSLEDKECGEFIAKIVIKHSEARDEIFWQYGLRSELPPPNEVVGLKKLDLSINKLGNFTAYHLSKALKNDCFLRQLNLCSNAIGKEGIFDMLDRIKQNTSLLNLDLRDNDGFKTKSHRKLALKLL